MKKALGLLALVGVATAAVVYKFKKDEEKKEIVNLDSDDEDGEEDAILRNVKDQSFEPLNYDDRKDGREQFSTKTFPHLDESEIIRITNLNEEVFSALTNIPVGEEHPIQHSVAFEKEIDLEEFKNIVIGEGYVVTNGESDTELLVLHIAKMDQDDISAKVFYLADLAKAHRGVYEGWLCKQ